MPRSIHLTAAQDKFVGKFFFFFKCIKDAKTFKKEKEISLVNSLVY